MISHYRNFECIVSNRGFAGIHETWRVLGLSPDLGIEPGGHSFTYRTYISEYVKYLLALKNICSDL